MVRGHVVALVGAQYGSEGKGVVAYHLRDKFDIHVRVGGPNAGHTFRHEGRLWKMQQIPCGWTNPEATLVIGAGALIDLNILYKEIEKVERAGYSVRNRILIDGNAHIIDPIHKEEEGGVEGEIHQRIGSTGTGTGAARMARMSRDAKRSRKFRDVYSAIESVDTVRLLNDWIVGGRSVLLEGTQGSGLSLIHGPWPYVTSHDSGVAQLLSDTGIAPDLLSKVVMVARLLPIRVAGNSGPLEEELTWEQVSEMAGRPVTESTTVTKKTRRIGTFQPNHVADAIRRNGICDLVLTFLDYIHPEVEGLDKWHELSEPSRKYVEEIESLVKKELWDGNEKNSGIDGFDFYVAGVGTGGPNFSIVDLGIG